MNLDQIADPIAVDQWRYSAPSGRPMTLRSEIGRPQRAPNDRKEDWYCPIFIEHFMRGVVPIIGVGPVDALMNAMTLCRRFADQIGEFTPRAADHADPPPMDTASHDHPGISS